MKKLFDFGRFLKKIQARWSLYFFKSSKWQFPGSLRNQGFEVSDWEPFEVPKTPKSITFFTINDIAFRHVEIPYKTNGKWSFLGAKIEKGVEIIKKALPTQRFRNAFPERQKPL